MVTVEKQFIHAAGDGNLSKVQRLLQAADALLHTHDSDGKTALHRACEKGHMDVVQYLTQHPHSNLLNHPNHQGETPLMTAVDQGHTEIVTYLLQRPAVAVNAQDQDQWTALHWACQGTGNLRTVELLVGHPDLDSTLVNADDKTAVDMLDDKTTSSQAEAIQKLVWNASDVWSTTPAFSKERLTGPQIDFVLAAQDGQVGKIQELLKESSSSSSSSNSVSLLHASFPNGRTALHMACKYGQAAVVELLCRDARVFVNARDAQGWTALHWACWKGHVDCVALMVDHRDIDVHARNQDGQTPLELLSRERASDDDHKNNNNNNEETDETDNNNNTTSPATLIRQMLLDLDPQSSLTPVEEQWFSAARAGRTLEIQHLLEQGLVSLEAAHPRHGRTLLHTAARYGHLALLEVVAAASKNPPWDAVDSQGRTALHEACRWHEHLEVVQFLLARMTAAQVNAYDAQGRTALHTALLRKNTQAVTCLLEDENVDPHLSLLWIVETCGVGFLEVFAASFTKDPSFLRTSIRNAFFSVQQQSEPTTMQVEEKNGSRKFSSPILGATTANAKAASTTNPFGSASTSTVLTPAGATDAASAPRAVATNSAVSANHKTATASNPRSIKHATTLSTTAAARSLTAPSSRTRTSTPSQEGNTTGTTNSAPRSTKTTATNNNSASSLSASKGSKELTNGNPTPTRSAARATTTTTNNNASSNPSSVRARAVNPSPAARAAHFAPVPSASTKNNGHNSSLRSSNSAPSRSAPVRGGRSTSNPRGSRGPSTMNGTGSASRSGSAPPKTRAPTPTNVRAVAAAAATVSSGRSVATGRTSQASTTNPNIRGYRTTPSTGAAGGSARSALSSMKRNSVGASETSGDATNNDRHATKRRRVTALL